MGGASVCVGVCVCVNFTCLRNRCLNLKRGHGRRPHGMPDTLLMLVLLFISCFTIAWTTQVVLEFWFESARAASVRQFFQTGFERIELFITVSFAIGPSIFGSPMQ